MKPSGITKVGLLIGAWFVLKLVGLASVAQAQQYLGCWKDDGSRVLNGYNTGGDPGNMTNERCVDICREKGFPFAGTQWSWCFCGNNYDRLGRADESACRLGCSGNSAEKCGGDYANSVYRVNPSTSTGGTTQPPQPPPLPRVQIRPPNAPTISGGGVTIDSENEAIFSWQNNGHPDGYPVGFWVDMWYWDTGTQSWKQFWAGSVNGTSFKFPIQPGSSTYFAWRVFAVDWGRHSNPWYTASNWSASWAISLW